MEQRRTLLRLVPESSSARGPLYFSQYFISFIFIILKKIDYIKVIAAQKHALKFSLLILGFFVICSCGNENTPEVTILGENSSTIQAMQDLEKDYEQKSNVELDFKPNTFEDAFNKSNQDFANKTGQYDVVLQYNFSLSTFIRNDYVYRLDELKRNSSEETYDFEGNIFKNVWKEVGYYYSNPNSPDPNNIEPVAYPFAANTMLLVYNKELFSDPVQKAAYKEKYGQELVVPTDMATFKRVAQFFTQPDKGLSGVCLQGATGGWLYYEWCSFIQGFGGKLLDKEQGWQGDANTPVLLTQPEVIEGAKYYKSLKPFNAGNFTTTDGVKQRNILKKGNVAMGIIWSDYVWGLISEGDGTTDERFGFAPTPGNKSMIAGGSFFVNKQSEHPDEAFDYTTYLLKKENQVKMLQNGLCSPLKTAYDSPEVQDVPFAKPLKKSLERAEYMLEAGPDADLISNTITTYVQKIWNDELSVEEGMRLAKEKIERERIKFYQ